MKTWAAILIIAIVLLTLVAAGVILLPPGENGAGKTLVIATSTDYPPFSYIDAEGNPAGFDYQYGNMLCQALESQCQWETVPFEQVFENTRQGKFDLAVNSFTRTEYREQQLLFSEPYYRAYGQFVRRAGSNAAVDETSLVAVQAGTIYEKYLNSPSLANIPTLSFENQEDAFRAVAEGRADLTIADDVITDLAVNQSPFLGGGQLGPFERVGQPITPAPGTSEFESLGAGEIGIVVPNSNANLLSEINRAIREINQGDAIAEVSRGYFGRNIVAR